MTIERWMTILSVLFVATTPSVAQVQIDERRPAVPLGEVYVHNDFGAVRVSGWDREEIAVSGTLAAGAEDLDVGEDDAETSVQVEVPDIWFYQSDDDSEYHSDLVLSVPRGSAVYVETTNATVEITDIHGEVVVETINGSVTVRGNPPRVEIETITGAVDVTAQGAEMEVETVSGAVALRGTTGEVAVTTVSGSISVQGDRLGEVDLETTAGAVRLDASFVEEGEVDVETFDGLVEMILPQDVKARFQFVTFSGQIRSVLGPSPHREGRFTPFNKLDFSTGLNDFDVSVETYSGDITLGTR